MKHAEAAQGHLGRLIADSLPSFQLSLQNRSLAASTPSAMSQLATAISDI